MMNTLTKLHVATDAWMATTLHNLRQRKEAGQTSAEMLGLILVVASALFIGSAALGGNDKGGGAVVNAITSGMARVITKALETLGLAPAQ